MQIHRRIALNTIVLAGLGAAGLVSGLIAGCATGPQVRAEFDPQADFGRYASFGFVDPLGTDRAGYQTMVSQYLKDAATRELQARGLRRADSDPDLLVNFNAQLSEKVRVSNVGPAYPYYGYYGYRRGLYGAWPMYPADTWATTYNEGTLNVDLVDRARRQMVWEGVAVDTVTEKSTENLRASIDAVIAALFAKLPLPTRAAAPAGK